MCYSALLRSLCTQVDATGLKGDGGAPPPIQAYPQNRHRLFLRNHNFTIVGTIESQTYTFDWCVRSVAEGRPSAVRWTCCLPRVQKAQIHTAQAEQSGGRAQESHLTTLLIEELIFAMYLATSNLRLQPAKFMNRTFPKTGLSFQP